MTAWPMSPLARLLTADRRPVNLVADRAYTEVGVRSFGRGVFHKPAATGAELGTKRVFSIIPDRLVFNIVFAWEGAVARTTDAEAGTIASHPFPIFECAPGLVDLDFMTYLFRSEFGLELMRRASPGSAGRNRTLSIAELLATEVPVPPLPEQQRIAAWLGRIDERIGEDFRLRGMASRLDSAARESLLSVTSVGEPRVRLGDALESIRNEIVIGLERDYRTIGIKSFGKGLIRYPSTKGADLSKMRFYRFPVDSLAVSNIQAWEGALAMTTSEDGERVASSRFFFYVRRPTGRLDPEFALAFLRTQRGFALVKAASPGTTMRNKTLSLRSFEDILIPDPGPDVQRRTVQALRTLDRLERERNEQMVKEKSLLPAALNQVFGSLN